MVTLPTCQGEYSRIFLMCLLAHHLEGKSRRRRAGKRAWQRKSIVFPIPAPFFFPLRSQARLRENWFLQSESKVLVHSVTGESFVPNMEPLPCSSFSAVVPSQSSLGSADKLQQSQRRERCQMNLFFFLGLSSP